MKLKDEEKAACIKEANALIEEIVAFLVDVTCDNVTDASEHIGQVSAQTEVLRNTFLEGALRAARVNQ